MPRKIDWKDLTKRGGDLIVTEQNASYTFLQEKLGISPGVIVKLLKRLETKNLVRRGKGRRWVVLVNTDGSPKSAEEVPEKRRFKRPKRTRPSGAITDEMKIEFVQHLAGLAEGDKARILQAVVDDLTWFSKERKLIEALKG